MVHSQQDMTSSNLRPLITQILSMDALNEYGITFRLSLTTEHVCSHLPLAVMNFISLRTYPIACLLDAVGVSYDSLKADKIPIC